MTRAAGRFRRWARRLGLGLGSVAALALAAVAVLTGTAAGRAWVLERLLALSRSAIAGTLEVRSLERLSPFGVRVRDVRLLDPAASEVVSVDEIRAELEPLELIRGRIAVRSLAIGPARVDVRDLERPDRGLLAALQPRTPSPPAASGGASPHLVVETLELRDVTVIAPELGAPWQALSVRRLSASARVEIEGAPDVQLRELACELWRGNERMARLSRAAGQLGRPGHESQLELEVQLEPEPGGQAAQLALRARGTLPDLVDGTGPFDAELQLGALRAADLARWLEDPALGQAFLGAVELAVHATGTSADATLSGTLGSAAGRLALRGAWRERQRLSLELGTDGLQLGALRAGLPEPPLAFSLAAAAVVGDRTRVPLSLRWQDARLGGTRLPDLAATATWNGTALNDLQLTSTRGSSALRLEGTAGIDGLFDVELHADVRRDELLELSGALGLARAPADALTAELRLARMAGERWRIAGGARGARLAWPGLAVASARADVTLAGPLSGLLGNAELVVDGVATGGLAVRAARVRLDATERGYHLRGGGRTERASAALDLRTRREPNGMSIWGDATARLDALPLALRIAPTRVGFDGSVDTRGISIDAGGQRVQLRGSYAAERAEWVASATGIDLATLAAPLGLGSGWRGRGDLDLRVRGRPVAPRVDAALHVRDIARDDAPAWSGRAAAALDVARRRASFDAVVAGAVTAPGRSPWLDAALSVVAELPAGPRWWEQWRAVAPRAALELRGLELPDLARWLGRPLPGGRVTVSGQVGGSVARPRLDATSTLRLERWRGVGPFSIAQRVAYDAGAIDATLAIDDSTGRWLDLGARLELPPGAAEDVTALGAHASGLADASRWKLSLGIARRSLGALWAAAPSAAQPLELDGALQIQHAPRAEPNGKLELHVAQVAAAAPGDACAPADVRIELLSTLNGGAVDATLRAQHHGTELLNGTLRAPLQLAPALRGGPLTLGSLSGELLSRGLELQALPLLCERARGRLDVHARADDLLGSEPRLELDASAAGLSLGADPRLELQLRGHADRDDASLNVEVAARDGGRGSLSAELPISWQKGRLVLSADAPLRARAVLDRLPIAPFLDPAGALSYASGSSSGTIDVGGTLREPQPSGHIELRDAQLTATALAQPLNDVQGRFSFDRRSLVIERFQARDRDGLLALTGRIARQQDAGSLNVELSAKAKRFPLRQRGQVVATTSGRAEVVAAITPSSSTVRVKLVDVDTWLEKFQARSGIDLRAHPDYERVGSDAAAAAGTPEETPSTSLVRIDASDRFWIKREDFAIQLTTQLQAQIQGDETRIKGRVEINRGYLDLLGRVFNVERGSYLELTGSSTPDPTVAITAKYESRSAGKTITVQIGGRGSKPELKFSIDQNEISPMEALQILIGGRNSGGESSAKQDAASFVQGLTAGLLATSARRELGAAAPIIMIEPGQQTGDGRIRAGFELDALVPRLLRHLITGVYLEGIVEREGSTNAQGQSQQASTQAGVLVELYFPHQLFTTGQWGPGTTWSLDWGWQL